MSHLSVFPDSSEDCPLQPASNRATRRSPIRIIRCLTRFSDLPEIRKTMARSRNTGPSIDSPPKRCNRNARVQGAIDTGDPGCWYSGCDSMLGGTIGKTRLMEEA
jgi:hypothetical protein